MSKTIITVENLSKSYLVGHEFAQRERYTALRDVIAREARNFARKTADLLHGRQIVRGRRGRRILGIEERKFRGQGRRSCRHHRPQWRWKKHATEDSLTHHRTKRRSREDPGPRREPARGRHRISPRANGSRKHFSEWRHPRNDTRRNPDAISTRSLHLPKWSGFWTRQ